MKQEGFHHKKFNEYFDANIIKKDVERLRKNLESPYIECYNKHIKEKLKLIKNYLNNASPILIIPLKEKRDTIKFLLKYIEKRYSKLKIMIINDESDKKIINEVKKFKQPIIINKNEILEIIDWKRLLPILNLNKIPKGKGTTIFAGYLFLYLFFKNDKNAWIFHTDADIHNPEKFRPLEYLTYGILRYPTALQIKIAQGGRNNECNMAIRSSLIILKNINKVVQSQVGEILSRRAEDLFKKLSKYKWILGGTFALPIEIAFDKPFATGYLEEMLTCAFVEDLSQKTRRVTVQISNPNPCRDTPNDFIKESVIVQSTGNFIFTLLLAKKHVYEWDLNYIAWMNKNLLNDKMPMVFIPPKNIHKDVIILTVPQERILPSIKMLFENNLIIKRKLEKIIKKYNFIDIIPKF
jgi:hypothetical protein